MFSLPASACTQKILIIVTSFTLLNFIKRGRTSQHIFLFNFALLAPQSDRLMHEAANGCLTIEGLPIIRRTIPFLKQQNQTGL